MVFPPSSYRILIDKNTSKLSPPVVYTSWCRMKGLGFQILISFILLSVVNYLLSYPCVFKGEHCDIYVKRFEHLFGSSRGGQIPVNGGIN